MSKPREPWWGHALKMIRLYKSHQQELDDLHQQSITANLSDVPKAGGDGRSLERIALRTLHPEKQKEYEAVSAAILKTQALPQGDAVLRIIDMVHWRRSHTIEGASMVVGVSVATAKRYHADFVRTVGTAYGFIPRNLIPQSQKSMIN